MKLDTGLHWRDMHEIPALAKAAEDVGFDALWSAEAGCDALLPLAIAAVATERIKLGTAVVLAFPRSPMALAYMSWDLARASKGRFILGLGTQVKGHIERRFSTPWLPPVPRMREYIESLRAIFKCWAEGGKKLSYQGKYYNFSLMTPAFTPAPHEFGNIPLYTSGLNKYMCQLAGELCDGFHVHPFHTAKYLRESVMPNVKAGLRKAGRRRQDIQIATGAFVIVGRNDGELHSGREAARRQIAFYGSTRTYKPVFDAHGWGDVTMRLNEKTAKGDWAGMPKEISDEMLEAFAITGTFDNIAGRVKANYDGLLDRVYFYFPFRPGADDQEWRKVAMSFNA
jgi:probable F420-dependent oxidoreductase